MAKRITAFVSLVVLPVVIAGCASWWQRTPEHVVDVAKILKCVDDGVEAGIDPKSIALTCGLANADAVFDLLRTESAIEAKRAKRAAALSIPAPSSSASAK